MLSRQLSFTVTTVGMSATATESDADNCSIVAVICAFMAIGVLLNFVAAFTYLRKRRRKPTHIFTMCLAIADFFNCLFLLLAILRLLGVSKTFEKLACILQPYLTHSGKIMSGSLVISIAFERCRKVASPFRVVARERYWIVVLISILTGLLLPSTVVVYRVVGYSKLWIPENEHVIKEDYTVTNIITVPEILVPVTFYCVVILIFAVGFLFIIGKYSKLIRLIMSKKQFGHYKNYNPRERSSGAMTVDKGNARSDIYPVSYSTDGSSMCLAVENDGVENNDNEQPDYKVRESAVFTIFPEDYYRKLSRVFEQPPDNINHPRIQKEIQTDNIRRRTSTLSIATRPRLRSPLKTIILLSLAVLSYLFYFPNLVLMVINFVRPSVKDHLIFEVRFLYEIIEYSYMFTYALNPVLYTFFNHGFLRDFNRAFSCGRSLQVRSSSFSTPRSSTAIPFKCKAQTKSTEKGRNVTKTKQYPYLPELEKRLLHVKVGN